MINWSGLQDLRLAGGQSMDLAFRGGAAPLPPMLYAPPPSTPPLVPLLIGAGLAYVVSRYADLPTVPTVAAGAVAAWVLT